MLVSLLVLLASILWLRWAALRWVARGEMSFNLQCADAYLEYAKGWRAILEEDNNLSQEERTQCLEADKRNMDDVIRCMKKGLGL